MTRKEHLEWCKARALEYLDRGDIQNAVTSMMSDLGKHPGTETSLSTGVAMLFMNTIMTGDTACLDGTMLEYGDQIRGYARNRATVALSALHPSVCETEKENENV